MSDPNRPLKCVFLGYLWKLARALSESRDVRLLGVGIEPQRQHSSEAIMFCENQNIRWVDVRKIHENPEYAKLVAGGVDLIVVGAFGQILRPEVLSAPTHGVLNLHTSLLPEYRGGSPIEEQILNGDRAGGVTLHWMTPGVDDGPIAASCPIPIETADYYGEVFERYHEKAGSLLAGLLAQSVDRWPRTPQNELSPVRKPRTEADGALDFHAPAEQLCRRVRALGWRGWAKVRLHDGDLVVERAEARQGVENGAAPGTVLETHPSPVIATGAGQLVLTKYSFSRALTPGETLA